MFLTGERHGNPFLQNRLLSFVAGLRDQKQGELSEVATPRDVPEDAVLDSLGSEASSSSTPQTPTASRLSAERRRALMTQFQIVTVEFPFGGEKVAMRIKTVATKAEAPSFEATPANFRALFCWFSEEGAKQLEHVPAIKPKAIHRPSAHPDGRRYYRKDRGCFYVKRRVPTSLRSIDPTETTSSCPTPPKASKKSSNGQTPLTFVTTKRKMGRPHKRVCAASLSPSDFFADESGSALELSSASPACDAEF